MVAAVGGARVGDVGGVCGEVGVVVAGGGGADGGDECVAADEGGGGAWVEGVIKIEASSSYIIHLSQISIFAFQNLISENSEKKEQNKRVTISIISTEPQPTTTIKILSKTPRANALGDPACALALAES